MRKETRFNLQCDWEGICAWHGIKDDDKRKLIDAVAFEVDCYRKQPFWRRLFKLMPKWEMEMGR